MSERTTAKDVRRACKWLLLRLGVQPITPERGVDHYTYGGGYRMELSGHTPMGSRRYPAQFARDMFYNCWNLLEWRLMRRNDSAKSFFQSASDKELRRYTGILDSLFNFAYSTRYLVLCALIKAHNDDIGIGITERAREIEGTNTLSVLRFLHKKAFGSDGACPDHAGDIANELAQNEFEQYRIS